MQYMLVQYSFSITRPTNYPTSEYVGKDQMLGQDQRFVVLSEMTELQLS